MTSRSGRATGGSRPSAARGLEGGGCDLLEVEPEVLSMRAESVEGPGEVGLHGDADRATRRDDAEEDARAMRAWNSRSVAELSIGTRGSSMKRVRASQWFR
jgi:hypothetical protein